MNHDPLDIDGPIDARIKAEELTRLRAGLEADDLRWLMSNKRGRRIVYRALERAGVWRLSFNTNALTMAFNEGQRNQGLAQLAMLMEHCAENYALMLKEQTSDE